MKTIHAPRFFLPCLSMLLLPWSAIVQAQRDPLREVDSLISVLSSDFGQLPTDPTVEWPIEREARTPHQKAVAGLARVRLMTLPNDSRAALTVLDRVIDLLAGTCDELTLACAHAYKANVEAVRNNIAGDIVHLERALRITARVPYPRLNAQIESSMGWAYCQMNDIRKGQEHFLAALSGPLSAKDRYWCLTSLVEVEARMGDLEAALEHIGQIEALVDSVGLNPALLELAYADVKMKQGDHAGAIEMLHRALERYRVGRSRAFQAWTLSQLSLAHRTVGLDAEAI